MSRSTRALVAIGVAAALVAGSGATFARWYDERAIDPGQITTGSLSLSAVEGSDSWLINRANEDSDAEPSVPFNPAVDRVVPGDVVSYTTKVKVNLVGKNLQASFAVLPPDAKGLGDDIVAQVDSAECEGANMSLLTEADNGKTCTVRTTITYPIGADDTTSALPEKNLGNSEGIHGDGWQAAPQAQERTISLDGYKLVLEQNARP
ncbi:alternate-type signal peptide domain-containing protein [Actinomyces sp.]|uniref:alternate-type signal peptide domain-containing protein n=1 Tax=Actinomyces sp. TaxID=29317 RepID=UPI0026DC6D40|nr:alternate-type signal peptide domain-containing protein [Actinomyces sp.]MDO4900013.1 alternate-type signal peptide domain-containing protein [Actinomyces sp.]